MYAPFFLPPPHHFKRYNSTGRNGSETARAGFKEDTVFLCPLTANPASTAIAAFNEHDSRLRRSKPSEIVRSREARYSSS